MLWQRELHHHADKGRVLHVALPEGYGTREEPYPVLVCLDAQWTFGTVCDAALNLGVFTNRWLVGGLLVGNLLQIAVIYVPFLQAAFQTAPLTLTDWLVCLAVSSTVLWPIEILKFFARRVG